jgi:formate dehydrogenase assembly factor FdhD
MEDKNIYCKFTYKCGICGAEYNNVLDRAKCEIACTERIEEEERKVEELMKKEEQKVRKAEVDAAFKDLHNLVTAYVKDYGHYEYGDGGEDTNFHWPSRLWHSFW